MTVSTDPSRRQSTTPDTDSGKLREQMVQQQLRTWEVLDLAVLATFARLERERFVPASYTALAYADLEIPLGRGEYMLAPKVAGRIVQAVTPQPTDRVLEIGTGSGYLTAALAAHACSVTSLEIDAAQAASAREHLAAADVRNATVLTLDAFAPEALGHQPWDVIVLGGSLPVPDERFQRQLSLGGRLFVVVGEAPIMEARLIERTGAEAWRSTRLFETALRALHGARQPPSFQF